MNKERYVSVYDKGKESCVHDWEYEGPGWDVGMLKDGGTYEEEQEMFNCPLCGSCKVEGIITYYNTEISED